MLSTLKASSAILASPPFRRLSYNVLAATARVGYRYLSNYAQNSNLKYIKHAFSREDAMKKIAQADQSRLFAPIQMKSTALAVTDPKKSPLRKILIPMFGVNAKINHTDYEGKYGVHRIVFTTNSKGHVTTHTVTDWYPISGRLERCSYGQEYSHDMSIYAGSSYHHKAIEEALECHFIQDKLVDFDADQIDKETHIDCFDKKDAYGREKANERIRNAEYYRAKADIKRRIYCDEVEVNSVSINADTTIAKNILPAYILKYDELPPRVLAAIDADDNKVTGPAPVSTVKVMATTTAVAGVIAMFLPPHISITARMMFLAFSALSSGLFSSNKLHIQNAFHESDKEFFKSQNETISGTPIDEQRRQSTMRDMIDTPEKNLIDVGDEFYETLGLNPDDDVTDDKLKQAVHKKLLLVHSDKGGTDEETRKVLEAREQFNHAMHPQPKPNARSFSTYARPQPLKQKKAPPPRCVYYEDTNEFIDAVMNGDLKKADQMVVAEKVHPDGHSKGENTLLTEAVRRKNVAAVKLALERYHCSPDASCDCPENNTAMHYAAKGATGGVHADAERKIMILLLEHGARVNMLNSACKTPLELAKDEKIKQLLIEHGAKPNPIQGVDRVALRLKSTFFGLSPKERTQLDENILLLKKPSKGDKASDKPISLPK